MKISTNGGSVMTAKGNKNVVQMSPRQYAGANGSLTKAQVKSFHNTKGKSLGTTKGKKVSGAQPKFRK